MEYILRPAERRLSMVIAPFDDYARQAARSVQAEIALPFPPCLIKPEGFCVFYDLPPGSYKVRLQSKWFFPKTVTVSTGNDPVVVRMLPNRRYPLPNASTWIEGIFPPDTTVQAIPQGVAGIKLLRAEEDRITLLTALPWDLTHKWLLVGSELCRLTERFDEYTYRLTSPLAAPPEKKAAVYPVNWGQTDSNGFLFCPLGPLLPEQEEVLLGLPDTQQGGYTYERYPIIQSRGNIIERRL